MALTPTPCRAGPTYPPNHDRAGTVLVPDLLSLPLQESPPVISDTPVGLRLKDVDPCTGDEHYLVHYMQGLRAARHHHTAATPLWSSTVPWRSSQSLGPGSSLLIFRP